MPSEVLSIQVGGCGNRLAAECWKHFCIEHGIEADGIKGHKTPSSSSTESKFMGKDSFHKFFYSDDGNYFIPRTVFVDLESKAINSALASEYLRLFKRENIFYPSDNSDGSNNNWFTGYSRGHGSRDAIFDIIDFQLEKCDSLESFSVYHSIAGGTGAGMGSFIIEQLADRYPKKFIQTFSVIPNRKDKDSMTVQPYNAVLTLGNLAEYADSVMLFDNTALYRMTEAEVNMQNAPNRHMNRIISKAIVMASAPIRFSIFGYNTWHGLTSSLIPHPNLKFLIPSYAPLRDHSTFPSKEARSPINIMWQLTNPQNSLVSDYSESRDSHRFLSVMQLIRGQFDSIEVLKASQNLQKILQFPAWRSSHFPILRLPSPPYAQITSPHHFSGLMLSNHTSMAHILKKFLHKFDELKAARDFLNAYLRSNCQNEDEITLDEARNRIDDVCKIYESSTKDDFFNWKKPNHLSRKLNSRHNVATDDKLLDRLNYANQLLKELSLNLSKSTNEGKEKLK